MGNVAQPVQEHQCGLAMYQSVHQSLQECHLWEGRLAGLCVQELAATARGLRFASSGNAGESASGVPKGLTPALQAHRSRQQPGRFLPQTIRWDTDQRWTHAKQRLSLGSDPRRRQDGHCMCWGRFKVLRVRASLAGSAGILPPPAPREAGDNLNLQGQAMGCTIRKHMPEFSAKAPIHENLHTGASAEGCAEDISKYADEAVKASVEIATQAEAFSPLSSSKRPSCRAYHADVEVS
eukprot:766751-Hanusia_phi.AAC.17